MKKHVLPIINFVCWLLIMFNFVVTSIAFKREVADWLSRLSWSLALVGYLGALIFSIVNILKHRKLKKTVAKLQKK